MKNLIVIGLIMAAGSVYGQQAPEPIVDESVKAEVLSETDGVYTQEYLCQKGSVKKGFKIEYRKREGEPPCDVFAIQNGGKTKSIGHSTRTVGVCEAVVDKIIRKMEGAGFDCDSATIPD